MPGIDRQATTPFLIRIFSSHGGFHRADEFDVHSQPRNEINLYSWKDATLGELTTLLTKELVGDSDSPVSSFKFGYRLIYGDNARGRFLTRDIGTVQVSHESRDSQKSLQESRFVVGDWIDIAVLQPGDRLYDQQRSENRDNYQRSNTFRGNSRHQGPGYGGTGYSGRGGYSRGGYQGSNGSSYRPYDRPQRGGRRSPQGRWSNDGYQGRR